MTDPTFEIVNVTPDLAQRWLGVNSDNRHTRASHIEAYAADMAAGRWQVNAEAVKLAGTKWQPEKLLDGQNRLYAVLKSGQPFVRMVVAYHVDPNAQTTMDAGARRTGADTLRLKGEQHAAIQASVAMVHFRVEANRLAGAFSITNATIDRFVDDHPELVVSADIASRYSRKADATPSVVAYTHWRFAQLNLDEATAFWHDAAEKIGLTAGDPVLAMTSRFMEAKRSNQKLHLNALLPAVYRTWNRRREGKTLYRLPITPSDLPILK